MILKNSEKKDNNTLEIKVESSNEELEAAIKRAYNKNKGKIFIPGFRKGKAPLAIIEGMYGPSVFYQDALDDLAQEAFKAGIEGNDAKFIGMPQIADANVTDERTATFTFILELYPEVKLGQYKCVEVVKPETEVSDAEVENELKSVQNRNARIITVEDRAAQMGDTCNIDFDGYLDGKRFDGGKAENHELELGSHSFVPGFEEQVAGMTIGEEKDINITFPQDYAPELAGKDVVFKVKLNSISTKELPALDDEFAKDVSEFDTFDAYKADVKADLEKKKADSAKGLIREAALKKACDNMEVTVPETLVRGKIEEIIRNFAANYGVKDEQNLGVETLCSMLGIDQNMMTAYIRPQAEAQAKSDLLVNAVIAEEKIEGNEEQLAEYVKKVAESVGATEDQIKQYFGDEYIKQEYAKETAIDLIADSAVLVDAPAEEAAPVEEKAAEPKKTSKKKAAKKAEEAPAEEAATEAE